MKRNIPIFLYLISLVKLCYFSLFGFGLVDQGESLHNAQRILVGELPYQDFFAIFPPLDNYFYSLIFRLFGQSVLMPRIVASLIFAATPVLIFLIIRRFGTSSLALIAAILAIFIDVNAERLFFFTPVLLGLYLYFKGIDKKDYKLYFASGLYIGIASLIRLDIPATYGLAIFVAAAVNLFIKERREWFSEWLTFIKYTGLGLLMFPAFVTLWMIKSGIFLSFVDSSLVKSIAITKIHSIPFPSPFNLIPKDFSLANLALVQDAVWGYYILTTYLLTAIILSKNKLVKGKHEALVFLMAGLFALPYIFGRSDMGHFVKGGFPFLILSSFLIRYLPRFTKPLISFFYKVVLVGIIALLIIQSVWWIGFNDQKIFIKNTFLKINSRYIPTTSLPKAQTIEKSVEFLRLNSDENEPVLVLPYMAGLYYLADRPSATLFNNLLAGFITTEKGELAFIDQLEEGSVNAIVYDVNNGPKMKTPKLKDYNPLIHQYIMKNFQVVDQTQEGWLMMKRKK